MDRGSMLILGVAIPTLLVFFLNRYLEKPIKFGERLENDWNFIRQKHGVLTAVVGKLDVDAEGEYPIVVPRDIFSYKLLTRAMEIDARHKIERD